MRMIRIRRRIIIILAQKQYIMHSANKNPSITRKNTSNYHKKHTIHNHKEEDGEEEEEGEEEAE